MAKLKVGVIIGRFQVAKLHEGHLRLFQDVAAVSDRIVVLLGVSEVDGYTAENPLTFAQRQAMIQQSAPQQLAEFSREWVIMPLFDQRSNDDWSQQLDAILTGAYPHDDITLFGGRDSFADSYTGRLRVQKSTVHPVIPATGTGARAAIKESNTADFYAGQIFALQRQWARALPTVDIAMLRHQEARTTEVLLIQRADSGIWCFPGGFVDPTDASFELAAARELNEEVQLAPVDGAKSMKYIGTYRINDFRYRNSRDKIITTFFMCNYAFGKVVVNPTEVQDYKWVPLNQDVFKIVNDVHTPLIDALADITGGMRVGQ